MTRSPRSPAQTAMGDGLTQSPGLFKLDQAHPNGSPRSIRRSTLLQPAPRQPLRPERQPVRIIMTRPRSILCSVLDSAPRLLRRRDRKGVVVLLVATSHQEEGAI